MKSLCNRPIKRRREEKRTRAKRFFSELFFSFEYLLNNRVFVRIAQLTKSLFLFVAMPCPKDASHGSGGALPQVSSKADWLIVHTSGTGVSWYRPPARAPCISPWAGISLRCTTGNPFHGASSAHILPIHHPTRTDALRKGADRSSSPPIPLRSSQPSRSGIARNGLCREVTRRLFQTPECR